MNPVFGPASRMEQWLKSAARMESPAILACDFDGTLVPRFAEDEQHFMHLVRHSQQILARLLEAPERIGGVCTSRSIHEVRRILDSGFVDHRGQQLSGISAAENGACIFCHRLSREHERKLDEAGFRIDHSIPDLTVITLARYTPDILGEKVVGPAISETGIAPERWSSSVGENHRRDTFQRLFHMSKHSSPEFTEQACVRFGSAYVKVYDTPDGQGRALIDSLARHAEALGVLCLITPPLEGHPVWTADLGGGVTKYDAMKSICEVYGLLSGVSQEKLRVLFFGDGENDLPAFRYVSERGGASKGFLVDSPHGNEDRAARVAPGTHFLKGYYDLAGVVEGVRLSW